jgi:hypothetical protein
MRRDDVEYAMAARDDGVRKVTRFTWRAGAIGIICSALIAVAFGHNVRHTAPVRPPAPGTIVIPAQPPTPAQGAGQVISGAS